MMRNSWLAAGLSGAALGALASGFATAQETPESLLPPGFDQPQPEPTPDTPAPLPTAAPVPAAPSAAPPLPTDDGANPRNAAPIGGAVEVPPLRELTDEELAELPTPEELADLSTDELDDLFGLKPKYDIPPAARRSLARVGVVSQAEGGFPAASLAKQPAELVRAILAASKTPLVSRWGHILLRRTLASRLGTPDGMPAVEFAALRAGALNAMGEYAVARALIQDVDSSNWSEALANEAFTAFVAEEDPVGVCPFIRFQGAPETEGDRAAYWTMVSAICDAYAGEGSRAGARLERALNEEIAPAIDVLLARRFAGAAGRGRRAVSIEWDGVETLNAWRFSLANAVGEPLPEPLLEDLAPDIQRAGATAPMVPLAQRAEFAARAGAEGIFSAQALIDLYSEVYGDNAIGGTVGERARGLRSAYLAPEPSDRIDAMQGLWNEASVFDPYWSYVLTAYAAARVPASSAESERAGDLIASMLAAGLDRDALSWKPVVNEGSDAWALLALADADGGVVTQGAMDAFADADQSPALRKSQFLLAGLAGLNRISSSDRGALEARLDVDLGRETRWVGMIRKAAEVQNPALVALLVGLGMQGESWVQMTPLHLYHVTLALSQVGMDAEARMIAAEAVART